MPSRRQRPQRRALSVVALKDGVCAYNSSCPVVLTSSQVVCPPYVLEAVSDGCNLHAQASNTWGTAWTAQHVLQRG